MKRLLLQLLVMLAGMVFFFIDMKHESGSAVYQLYGFAHLAFFMLMAFGLSRLPDLARRPFLFQFALIVFVVLFVGGIIEVIQPYFGRTASWRDLGIDLLGALLGVMFLAPARRSLGRGLLAFGQFAVVAVGIMVFYGPIVTLWEMRQASRQFPMLGDFETRLGTRRWSSGEIDKGIARHGESSLRVSLGTGKYDATDPHRQFGQDLQDLPDKEGSAQNTRKEAEANNQASLPFRFSLHALSAHAPQPAQQAVLSFDEDTESMDSISRPG